MSPGRTMPVSRSATATSVAVARVVPDGVVDGLEPVEVDEQHGHALVRAPAHRQRLADAVEQASARFGQPGELVVEREAHELLFGALALGDVTRRRLELDDMAVAIDDRREHGFEPRVRATASADAVRELDRLAAGARRGVEHVLDVRAVLGVDP